MRSSSLGHFSTSSSCHRPSVSMGLLSFRRSASSFPGAAVLQGAVRVPASSTGVGLCGAQKKRVPLAQCQPDDQTKEEHVRSSPASSNEAEMGKLLDSVRPGFQKYARQLIEGEIFDMKDLQYTSDTYLMQLGILPHHARQILEAVQEKIRGTTLTTFSFYTCGRALCCCRRAACYLIKEVAMVVEATRASKNSFASCSVLHLLWRAILENAGCPLESFWTIEHSSFSKEHLFVCVRLFCSLTSTWWPRW
jgi:hypothetical protein